MKNIFQISAAILIITLSAFASNAQQYVEVKNEADFNAAFANEITKYKDTIGNNVNFAGIAFIKFNINKDGLLDSIKFSIKQPKVIIYALGEVLNKIKIVVPPNMDFKKFFVLPIFYDYLPESKPSNNMKDLLSQVITYDMNDLNSYLNFDSNGFFKVEESHKELWGINCVFLPMIKIQRQIIYH